MEGDMQNVNISSMSYQMLKDLGNKMFAQYQFAQAIHYYTLAIDKQSNISTCYSNRALCYNSMHEYTKALTDCRQAIELDRNNLKAHFFAGQAYLGLGQYDEALTRLVYSHNLALEQRRNYGDEITLAIRTAKRKRFEAEDEQRRRSEIALQAYLNNLIMEDTSRKKRQILHANNLSNHYVPCSSLSKSPHSATNIPSSSSRPLDDPSDMSSNQNNNIQVHHESQSVCDESDAVLSTNDHIPTQVQQTLDDMDLFAQKKISELNDLFVQIDERRQRREVPDYLCGRISFELMRDPVITPSGITYDRRSIMAHLQQVGHFDPLSRVPLTESQLIPNLAMKEMIQDFLEHNHWAETY